MAPGAAKGVHVACVAVCGMIFVFGWGVNPSARMGCTRMECQGHQSAGTGGLGWATCSCRATQF